MQQPKRYIKENLFLYVLLLSTLVVGIITGFVFSFQVTEESLSEVTQSLSADAVTRGGFQIDRVALLKTSFFEALRISAFLFISGLSMWLVPLSWGTIFLCGFSLGFTSAILSYYIGSVGIVLSSVSDFFSFLICIPVYITMAVVATVSGGKKSSGNLRDFVIYTLTFLVLFFILMFSVACDVFLVPELTGLICG